MSTIELMKGKERKEKKERKKGKSYKHKNKTKGAMGFPLRFEAFQWS